MYSTLTHDFARRASALASTGSDADLLYATLEIRLGVESRLQSYVQANDQVSAALKRGWQIPKLFKGLEGTFSNSSQAVEFVVSAPGIAPVKMHFIPVSSRLKRHAERFGQALHVTAGSHSSAKWWADLRSAVIEALRDLEICAQATLLGVPLQDPRTGHVLTKFEFHKDDPRLDLMQRLAESREPHNFMVTYLSTEGYYASAR
jgi:hypothetical protein